MPASLNGHRENDSNRQGRLSQNDRKLFRHLYTHGPTATDGFSFSRPPQIETRAQHYAHELEIVRDGSPRRPVIRFVPSLGQTLGIYIGTASVRMAIVDLNGEVLASTVQDRLNYHSMRFRSLLARLQRPLALMRDEAAAKVGDLRLFGATIALPTLPDPSSEHGMIAATYPAPWSNEPLATVFREELAVVFAPHPVLVSFDSDACADLSAELRFGSVLDGEQDKGGVLLVHLSGGISAAFIDGERVHRGTGPGASGLGHVVADLEGLNGHHPTLSPLKDTTTECRCGHDGDDRPHLDQVASGRAIVERLGLASADPDNLVSYRDALEGPLATIQEGGSAGDDADNLVADREALDRRLAALDGDDDESVLDANFEYAVTEAATVLGRALDSVVITLSPRVVILGGFMSSAGDLLRRVVTEQLQSRALRRGDHQPEVKLGTSYDTQEHRHQLGAIGAALLAMEAHMPQDVRRLVGA
jgi:predicted NBD/HSP70 family sugar kinase